MHFKVTLQITKSMTVVEITKTAIKVLSSRKKRKVCSVINFVAGNISCHLNTEYWTSRLERLMIPKEELCRIALGRDNCFSATILNITRHGENA